MGKELYNVKTGKTMCKCGEDVTLHDSFGSTLNTGDVVLVFEMTEDGHPVFNSAMELAYVSSDNNGVSYIMGLKTCEVIRVIESELTGISKRLTRDSDIVKDRLVMFGEDNMYTWGTFKLKGYLDTVENEAYGGIAVRNTKG